ncbi:MAG: hypothetical protein ACI9PP_002188 [Halobacteriales archaeon]|jgi:hypothetical protein
MARADLDLLFIDGRYNAALAWVFAAVLLIVAGREAIVGDPLWATLSAVVAILVILPGVAYQDALVMPPWEVVGLAALPVVGEAVASLQVTSNLGRYLSVAAIALLVAVELHAFTAVRMTLGFAVLFVIVTTMATAGVWAVVRWLSDVWVGTGFIGDETALMWEFVNSTAAGILGGLVFEFYFRRRVRADRRLPGEVGQGPTGDSS